jgi:hypothetical protein
MHGEKEPCKIFRSLSEGKEHLRQLSGQQLPQFPDNSITKTVLIGTFFREYEVFPF